MERFPTMPELRRMLTPVADPSRRDDMAAYMKDQFAFLGVTSSDRRKATRDVIGLAKIAPTADVLSFAERCWDEPERELQYVALDALRAAAPRFEADDLTAVRALIERRSWWDTVDGLAAWVVGPIVANHPQLAVEMDAWAGDDDIWIARTAILHQLGYKDQTDADRLFAYASELAGHGDFFIRKALGWALRQYARVAPDAVRAFVTEHHERLSGLTKREALRHLGG